MKKLLLLALIVGLPGLAPRVLTPAGPTEAPVAQAAAQSTTGGTASDIGVPGSATPAVNVSSADASTASLRADLAEILRRPRWTGDRWSVMVVSLDRGDTLFAHGASDALAPASNMKLFTTAAALYYLGPDFRFNTFLMSTGPVLDGVVDGDLVLYGTGDPTFSDRFGNRLAVWQAFADTLAALGVREVRGDIVGDGSYFEGPGAAEGWQESYMNAAYAASAGALSFAENVAMLQIRPAAQAGWRPEVSLVPGGEGIAIVNQATTVAGSGGRITARRLAYDGPIAITGQIGTGASPVLRSVPVSDPARFAAAMFREVLSRNQIVVTGGVRSALTADESPVTGRSVFAPALDSREAVRVLAVHTSEPISQVLDIINKRSHNLMAEQVLRTVGRVAVGTGSVAGGERAIRHMLEAEGRRSNGVRIFDGSGLSILNRSSAADIIQLLQLMAESPQWPSYWESLPEAGSSVGLRRMQSTPAGGNLRAKTGTIDRVSALSGYVGSAEGERLAFSIIANNVPSTWMAKRVEDAIGARLAEFSRSASRGQPVAPPAAAPATSSRSQAQPAQPGTGEARSHTIRSGDTLDAIARRYGTTVRALEQANPGLNARRLIPGRRINIP